MIKLSVNVNKIATLRNSRGGQLPDPVKVAKKCLLLGADGITVHPRPDGRHIRLQDVIQLREMIAEFNQQQPYNNDKYFHHREFNIEGYPSSEFLRMVEDMTPDQVTLVPDPPEALTSNSGWKVSQHHDFLSPIVKRLKNAGLRTSLFIDPYDCDAQFIQLLGEIGPDRVELYTEMLAHAFLTPHQDEVMEIYQDAAHQLRQAGFGLNAGHDLNLQNIGWLKERIPMIEEVSIGHALICEAIDEGLEKTITSYLAILRE